MIDIRAHVHDLVAAIEPYDDIEHDHIEDALQWIESGAPLCRVSPPDKPPKHLVSYFALVDPGHRSILLGDHIKAQLWLPSGGHVLPDEHPTETVRRESLEELDRQAMFLRGYDKPLFLTINQTVGLTPGHTDVSLWYLLRGNVHSDPAIFDKHMQRFVRKAVQWLG